MSTHVAKSAWAGPLVYRNVQEIDHKATGEAMRQLRKSHHLSQSEVARRMKVSAPFISDLERGNRNWDGTRALNFMQAVTAGRIAVIQAAMKKAHTGPVLRIGRATRPQAWGE